MTDVINMSRQALEQAAYLTNNPEVEFAKAALWLFLGLMACVGVNYLWDLAERVFVLGSYDLNNSEESGGDP